MSRKGWKSRRGGDEETTYWEPFADLLAGVLLIFILLAAISAFTGWRDEPEDDGYGLETEAYEETLPRGGVDRRGAGISVRDDENGGGGGGGSSTVDEFDGIYDEEDENGLAAVKLQMADGDTDKDVKIEGVTFALYKKEGKQVILHSWYPKKTEWREYSTESYGGFYLPEKLEKGVYEFRQLTAAPGYGISEAVEFAVTEERPWKDPLTVRYPLYAARNRLRLKLTDAETGKPIRNATFQAISLDGSSKGEESLEAGDVAATMTTDSDGVAESGLLYLGRYRIEQTASPGEYAAVESVDFELTDPGTDDEAEPIALKAEKTRVFVTVTDELYRDEKMDGAEYRLIEKATGKTRTVRIEDGAAEIGNLIKGSGYSLEQTKASSAERLVDETVTEFDVDGLGLIDGSPTLSLDFVSRVTRVEITAVDAITQSQATGYEFGMYDASGTLRYSPKTENGVAVLTGAATGKYELRVEGGGALSLVEGSVTVWIEDTAEIQRVTYRTFTKLDAGLIAVGAAGLVVAIATIAWFVARRRKRRNDG